VLEDHIIGKDVKNMHMCFFSHTVVQNTISSDEKTCPCQEPWKHQIY